MMSDFRNNELKHRKIYSIVWLVKIKSFINPRLFEHLTYILTSKIDAPAPAFKFWFILTLPTVIPDSQFNLFSKYFSYPYVYPTIRKQINSEGIIQPTILFQSTILSRT